MKIAFAHFRAGETDGVSLEMDKWINVLKDKGHECCYIAGSRGTSSELVYIIPEMYYKAEYNKKIVDSCYRGLYNSSAQDLEEAIYFYAEKIGAELKKIIIENNIDIVIPNNIWSLGWNLPCGVAFTNVARELSHVKFVGHNHDFYWERVLYSNPSYSFVTDLLEKYFLPDLPNVSHCVINSVAHKEVMKRRRLGTNIVPNVFDFEMPQWVADDYNRELKTALSLRPQDMAVLQATRIGERKTIEFGIEVVHALQQKLPDYAGKNNYRDALITEDSKPVYIFCGMEESVDGVYWHALKEKMQSYGIEYRYINDIIGHSRSEVDGKKTFSLWDAYVYSDVITYPSILEGWGNQLLEAVFAKKPAVIYEYPVYKSDIKKAGFSFVSLGDKYIKDLPLNHIKSACADRAADELLKIYTSKEKYAAITEKNFLIGKRSYSYSALSNILQKII